MDGKTTNTSDKNNYHSSPDNHTNLCFHIFSSILPTLSSLHCIVQHHLQPVTNFLKALIPLFHSQTELESTEKVIISCYSWCYIIQTAYTWSVKNCFYIALGYSNFSNDLNKFSQSTWCSEKSRPQRLLFLQTVSLCLTPVPRKWAGVANHVTVRCDMLSHFWIGHVTPVDGSRHIAMAITRPWSMYTHVFQLISS